MLEASNYPLEAVRNRSLAVPRSDVLVGVLLILTLLMGGYFRFVGSGWDDFARFHPDERYLQEVVALLGGDLRPGLREICTERYPDTNGRGGFFDTECSPYHPENVKNPYYVYGTLPVYMVRGAMDLFYDIPSVEVWTRYEYSFQVWRAMSAAADMVALGLVFLIGLRLHGKWTGLVAAILYAAAVTPIQQSHFGTTDAITNMFVTLALFFAVRTQDTGKWWDYTAFGMALGAAVASRVNVAPLAVVIIVVAVLRALPAFDGRIAWRVRNNLLTDNFIGLVFAGVASFVVFRICNPVAFSGPTIFGILPERSYLEMLSFGQHLVSGESEGPPNYQWVGRIGYLFPLQNMVLWGMGVALGLSAWTGWAWSLWRIVRGRPNATRNIVLVCWVLVHFAVFGNLWVMSMRYYLPLYPALAVLAGWLLVHLVQRTTLPEIRSWQRLGARALLVGVVGFTVLWALMFTNIYRTMASFMQASHWVWENVPGDFAMRIDGASEDVPLINIPIWNRPAPEGTPIEERMFYEASRLLPDQIATVVNFTAPADGTISSVQATRIGDPTDSDSQKTLRVRVRDFAGHVLGTAQLTGTFPRGDDPIGQGYELAFDEPFTVEEGERYTFVVEVADGALMTAGSLLMVESAWEEVMPAKVCQLPEGITLADNPPSGLNTPENCNGRSVWEGLLNGAQLETHWEDIPEKRDRMQVLLDQTDYVMIPTNRRYDTHSRNPLRWPMTNRFYDALFDGSLGFDLEIMFQETFELGPLKISDQYLPIYDAPEWLNEFEPEEAFTVYDHPVVFIFKKNENYSSANTAAILGGNTLVRVDPLSQWSYNDATVADVIPLPSLDADVSPNQLLMTDAMLEAQREGGTWSNRFDLNSILYENQAAALVLWWVMIVFFGWAMWPVLFMVFPALADRGFGVAKFTGIFLTAWSAWVLASLRIPVWQQGGILFLLVLLAAFSLFLVLRNRERFGQYLRQHWRLLLWIELITFALYLLMIGVRMTNPDLWHWGYGGEKPMDFAYFNGILRSTIFPPIDPWFAGGYLNYYYFGFVIVGAPTLLLGIVPSLAYNLIIPTIFAATGIAAFSVAFNITSGWRTTVPGRELTPRRRTMGNPWVAGVMALALAVLLGNLDTARVFMNGVAQVGGYQQTSSFQTYLFNQYRDDFIADNSAFPDENQLAVLAQAAEANADDLRPLDRLAFALDYPVSVVEGIGRMIRGTPLRVSPERWFWGPTRIITENVPGDGAITEMPYFTFLYADLHAHMLSMPMQLFVLVFLYNELIIAGKDRRKRWMQFGALFLGALTVGMFQATNTWEFPTFMILSVLGLGYAWWLGWARLSRLSLINLVVRVGGFVVLALAVALPFSMWFASGLTDFKIWEGGKTPLWAYLTIHGTFLFLLFSLLLWETGRWLRSVRVAVLRGRLMLLYVVFGALALILLGTLLFVLIGYQVALVVVPLVAWIALLFFRPGQSRTMQFVLVLAGLALAITLGTEFVTLVNDNGRQNSIFKFYLQAWLLLSVVGGVAFAWVTRNAFFWKPRLAVPWYLVIGLLLFVAALYPLQATRGKAVFRMTPTPSQITLDGVAFMRTAQHTEQVDLVVRDTNGDFVRRAFPGEFAGQTVADGRVEGEVATFDLIHDYNVIRWLQQNVAGSPAIMEAQAYGSVYRWGGRIAIHTGLPSVAGWDYHQTQQRSLEYLPIMVRQRAANVNAFYTTTSIAQAVRILRAYDVRYIVVTPYEKARYDAERYGQPTLAKFDEMVERGILSVAYNEGESTIYEVNQPMLDAVFVAALLNTTE
ncbi:MAG: hypothetical protein OHK0046_25890 [Anaerolineae bacterium]